MGKYGQTAIKAVNLIQKNPEISPDDAWEKAVVEIFGNKTVNQTKKCPKGIFLGLCEEGLVKGIKKGKYTKSKMNKQYAIKGLKLINEDPVLCENESLLWIKVMGGYGKKYNFQMDVIISLREEKLI